MPRRAPLSISHHLCRPMQRQTVLPLLLVALIGVWSSPRAAHAQSAARGSQSTFWVGGGLGLGRLPGADDADRDESLAGSLNASYQFRRHLISARAASAGELFGDNFYDYGLLYGRAVSHETLYVSLATGIAYVDGQRSEGLFDDPEDVDATVGLPLEAQVYVRPLRFVGIGLYGFANLNQEESFVGATLSVQIGLLK